MYKIRLFLKLLFCSTICVFTILSILFISCGNVINTSDSNAAYEAFDFAQGFIQDNPGNLSWYYHVPENMYKNKPASLVVAMHACTQSASEFKERTGWNELADKYKFYVLYPEQNGYNNPAECFNWFGGIFHEEHNLDPGNVLRKGITYSWPGYGTFENDGGESASIVAMVEKMKANYKIGEVYVTGLSPGGYMTAVLLAVYPDVFSAGAVMSGGPYLCSIESTDSIVMTLNSAYLCMAAVQERSAKEWGELVLLFSGYNKPADIPWPRIQIWHGTADDIVYPKNKDNLVSQWTYVHEIAGQTPEVSILKGHDYQKYVKDGESVVEVITIENMRHYLAVDPGDAVDQGGSVGAFTYDGDIWSSFYIARFFGLID